MNDDDSEYCLWGRKFRVGDTITLCDGTGYLGKILHISKNDDLVRHQCAKTGKVYEKSYTGFGLRYMRTAQEEP